MSRVRLILMLACFVSASCRTAPPPIESVAAPRERELAVGPAATQPSADNGIDLDPVTLTAAPAVTYQTGGPCLEPKGENTYHYRGEIRYRDRSTEIELSGYAPVGVLRVAGRDYLLAQGAFRNTDRYFCILSLKDGTLAPVRLTDLPAQVWRLRSGKPQTDVLFRCWVLNTLQKHAPDQVCTAFSSFLTERQRRIMQKRATANSTELIDFVEESEVLEHCSSAKSQLAAFLRETESDDAAQDVGVLLLYLHKADAMLGSEVFAELNKRFSPNGNNDQTVLCDARWRFKVLSDNDDGGPEK